MNRGCSKPCGIDHFSSVDLIVVVAESRLRMMFLVLQPIFLAYTRPRSPVGGFRHGGEAQEIFGGVSEDLSGETGKAKPENRKSN